MKKKWFCGPKNCCKKKYKNLAHMAHQKKKSNLKKKLYISKFVFVPENCFPSNLNGAKL